MISGIDAGPWHLRLIPLVSVSILALRSVIVTYDGWYEAIYFTEEDKNPARNLPRGFGAGESPADNVDRFLLQDAPEVSAIGAQLAGAH